MLSLLVDVTQGWVNHLYIGVFHILICLMYFIFLIFNILALKSFYCWMSSLRMLNVWIIIIWGSLLLSTPLTYKASSVINIIVVSWNKYACHMGRQSISLVSMNHHYVDTERAVLCCWIPRKFGSVLRHEGMNGFYTS